MPFRCKICELDILPGAPMVSNERDEVAHETCFRPVANLVAHTVSKPPVPAAPEPCISAVKQTICIVCGIDCISRCPCGALVCQAYSFERSCSLTHESTCGIARRSREVDSEVVKSEKQDLYKKRNGKCKKLK
jgi:hypothetical protein